MNHIFTSSKQFGENIMTVLAKKISLYNVTTFLHTASKIYIFPISQYKTPSAQVSQASNSQVIKLFPGSLDWFEHKLFNFWLFSSSQPVKQPSILFVPLTCPYFVLDHEGFWCWLQCLRKKEMKEKVIKLTNFNTG